MLLAFDLDNTVLTRTGELPERIRSAIVRAKASGWHVTVLTGRPHATARPYVERLELSDGPYAVNHGGLVFGAGGGVLRHRQLEAACVRALTSAPLRPVGLACSCVIDDRLLVEDPTDPHWTWAHTANRRVEPLLPDADTVADKVVYARSDVAETLRRRLHAAWPVTSYLWDDGMLEITATEADKGSALERIAAELRVPRERTVAFGDGPNDVTMLAWAGHGVAVGPGAGPELVAVADERIDAPEQGGVADWLTARLA